MSTFPDETRIEVRRFVASYLGAIETPEDRIARFSVAHLELEGDPVDPDRERVVREEVVAEWSERELSSKAGDDAVERVTGQIERLACRDAAQLGGRQVYMLRVFHFATGPEPRGRLRIIVDGGTRALALRAPSAAAVAAPVSGRDVAGLVPQLTEYVRKERETTLTHLEARSKAIDEKADKLFARMEGAFGVLADKQIQVLELFDRLNQQSDAREHKKKMDDLRESAFRGVLGLARTFGPDLLLALGRSQGWNLDEAALAKVKIAASRATGVPIPPEVAQAAQGNGAAPSKSADAPAVTPEVAQMLAAVEIQCSATTRTLVSMLAAGGQLAQISALAPPELAALVAAVERACSAQPSTESDHAVCDAAISLLVALHGAPAIAQGVQGALDARAKAAFVAWVDAVGRLAAVNQEVRTGALAANGAAKTNGASAAAVH